MNRKTIALTAEQYREIISTMRQGFTGCRPNDRAATALMLEANLGLRISDIVNLHLSDRYCQELCANSFADSG